MAIALFPGSFNPFTKGHLSIAERSSKIFDKVIIGIGVNISKTISSDIESRVEEVKVAVAHLNNIEVAAYSGLTTDFCVACGAKVIIRGLRNGSDFDYEQQLAEVNRRISGIETLFISSLPELSFISSSMIRELRHYGKDISDFLPKR